MQNYCLNDFVVCETHSQNYIKVKNKKDSQFYYLKKYPNKNLDEKKLEIIQKLLIDLADITKMEFKGLFTEETKEGKDLYLIFEFFKGKLFYSWNNFQKYEIWIIAKNLLEIFEKLFEKGIKFNKNENSVIDVFEINLNEIKVNIFDLINDDIKEENEGKNGILFNIGLIFDKIIGKYHDTDYNIILKGIKNDLKKNKLDITTLKTILNLFFKYSLYFDFENPEIMEYNKGVYYSGSLKDNKPDGIGVLVNECGIIYKGEFKDGKINGKGKSFIYNKNDRKKKIFEGTFIGEIKNGKYIEYNEENHIVFEGEYKDDKREGKGIEYDGQGSYYNHKIFEGEYKDDKREGKGIEYYEKIKLYEGHFKNDQKNGNGILYIRDGIKRYEGNFVNNFFHGEGKLFYDNGRIQYKGKFNKGFFSEEGFYYDYENNGKRIKVFNGLPLINDEFPKVFNIYYNGGGIHYAIYLNNYQLYGKEYNKWGKKIYSGELKLINMNEKEVEKIDLKEYRNNNNYIVFLKDGYGKSYDYYLIYEGEYLNGIYHGNGKEYDAHTGKLKYEGEYLNGIYHGNGKEYDADTGKLKYEGEYLNGIYHGNGKEYYADTGKLKYEGEYLNGLYHGNGVKYNNNGEKEFAGNFEYNNLKNGFTKVNGYEGEINYNLKEGKGKIFINNILRFEGTFKKDKFVEGIVYDINGNKFFDGKISDDNKKVGKFYENNELIFEGRYEDFYKMANHIVDFTNTCRINFEGEYKNGMKCGEGKDYGDYYYYQGYQGEFLYGMYHGKGKYNNDSMEGEFKNGKKTGFWKIDESFEGEYKDGRRNGQGKEDGWTGHYVNDYLHGIRSKNEQKKNYYFGEEVNLFNLRIENNCIYFNGIKEYEGDIIKNDNNAIKHGKGTEYYKNKNKRYEGSFQYGKHHGYGKEYYYDKEILKYEGEFKNDLYDKKGKEYDEKGQIIYDGEFKNGKYHGKGTLYRNGKVIYQGDFEENKLQGKGIEYNEEGEIVYSGEFRNNAYDGYGKKNLYTPYEGYWSKNRPNKLKQSIYNISKIFWGS